MKRVCGLKGELTPLATLLGGKLMAARLPTNRGGVYFLATTADGADSTLAANGVVLYVFVQRVLAAGAASLGRARQLVAGEATDATDWRQVAGPADAVSTDYPHHAGVYAAGDRLLAVNRSAAEDHAPVLADEKVVELFRGLDFSRVDDRAGGTAGLIQEVWRPFLVAMLVALLTEAALCMPRRQRPTTDYPSTSGSFGVPSPLVGEG